MPKYDDTLGDAIKAIEDAESMRSAETGQPIVVRVDGVAFSKFTKGMARPFDLDMSEAMVSAASAVVRDFHCRIGYTQSDEMSFILWHPTNELPHSGRLQKLASRFAAKATAAFLLEALERFPDRVRKQVPEFDGRATAFPSVDLAAKAILWRELDARKNSVSMAARAHFSANQLHGKSSAEMRAMLLSKGVDFREYPERFRRGVFLRRVIEERMLTDEELARIPEKHRPQGPVTRSRVAQVSLPPLHLVENLAEVLFEGAEPAVETRRFADAVIV